MMICLAFLTEKVVQHTGHPNQILFLFINYIHFINSKPMFDAIFLYTFFILVLVQLLKATLHQLTHHNPSTILPSSLHHQHPHSPSNPKKEGKSQQKTNSIMKHSTSQENSKDIGRQSKSNSESTQRIEKLKKSKFNSTSTSTIDLDWNPSLSLSFQILQLFSKDEELEKEVLKKSKFVKNTVQLSLHNRTVNKLKKQIQQLRHQLQHKQVAKEEEYALQIESLRKQRNELSLERRKENILPKEQNQDLMEAHQNLKGELEFCQSQLNQSYETEKELRQKLERYSKFEQSQTELDKLKKRINSMESIAKTYNSLERKYHEMKKKLQQMQTSPKMQEKNEALSSYPSEHSSISRRTSTIHYYRFLADCGFMDLNGKQFIYSQLHPMFRGVLKTQILYRSQRIENVHPYIHEVWNVLLLIELQNDKILGAFTHQPFSPQNQSPAQNYAFLFDVTNEKCFPNNQPNHTITYNRECLVWGYNEIMIKFAQPQILYSGFGRTQNVFWDKQHTLEDFIDTDQQWTRIKRFQLYKIIKI